MPLIEMLPPLQRYSWQEARIAYNKGEREFLVWSRYPTKRNIATSKSCGHCADTVEFIHLNHTEGPLVLRCPYCSAHLEGSLARVGVREGPIDVEQERLFRGSDRREIFIRDDCRCFMCNRCPDDSVTLEADHIIPFACDGPTHILNGITLCHECNAAKSAHRDERLETRMLCHTHRNMKGKEVKSTGNYASWTVVFRVATSLKEWGFKG